MECCLLCYLKVASAAQHQPEKEDILLTHVGHCVLLGTMSLQQGTAVQRACLMESMCVRVCVQTKGTATVMIFGEVNVTCLQCKPISSAGNWLCCLLLLPATSLNEREGGSVEWSNGITAACQ